MKSKLIVVSAVWCPSCLLLKKHLKRLQQEYPKLEIELLDYDLDEDEVMKYRVGEKLPVMISNDNKLVGEKSYEEIIKFLKDGDVI